MLTLVESHVVTLYLCARIAGVRHVIHKNIDVSTCSCELAIDKLENQETRFCPSISILSNTEGDKNV